MAEKKRETNMLPLVVDVDESLLKTDLLFECCWRALGRVPRQTVRAVLLLILKPAALKAQLAKLADLDIERLPRRKSVLKIMAEAKGEVLLASGADETLVKTLSAHLGLTSEPLASDGTTNLTGAKKAAALVARFGANNFIYIGDSTKDFPVWEAAASGYCVAPTARMQKALDARKLNVQALGHPARMADLFRALRPRQWLKNILLFLPLLAAHQFGFAGLAYALWGVAVFSAAASSIYIVNDLVDLDADRRHETKCKRPFAAGAASLKAGMGLSAILAVLALGGAALHSWQMAAITGLYIVLSLSYSLALKRLRWVDITVLAALYSLRVVAGSIVVGVAMSGWLGAFVFPVFLALGGVKRLIELGKTDSDAPLPGRGYARRDRADLRNVAITAAVGAVIVYLLYTYSEIAAILYRNPLEIRLAALPLALWLGRMIYLGWWGRMDYDPIVFALRDKIGLGLIALGAAMLLHAAP